MINLKKEKKCGEAVVWFRWRVGVADVDCRS